jgi:hypothetical protein
LILTAHQPVYLPWLGLFHKIYLADTFVHYNHVLHSPRDFTARNSIRAPEGELRLIVPLLKDRSASRVALKNLKIDNQTSWRRKHLKAIKNYYSKSQFFDLYYAGLEEIFTKEWNFIDELNLNILQLLMDYLNLKSKIIISSDLTLTSGKNESIIDMCKQLGAQKIIFGRHGSEYVEEKEFHNNQIDVYFQDYSHPEYKQRYSGFHSHLSVIDLLFNHGNDSLDILISGNDKKDSL